EARPVGYLQLQHHDCDDNSKHAVAECGQPVLVHQPPLTVFFPPQCAGSLRGHTATAFAKFYKRDLAEFLASAPKRGCRAAAALAATASRSSSSTSANRVRPAPTITKLRPRFPTPGRDSRKLAENCAGARSNPRPYRDHPKPIRAHDLSERSI